MVAPAPARAIDWCDVRTVPLNFGQYDAGTSSPVDTVSNMRVLCLDFAGTRGTWVATIDGGNSGDPLSRFLSSGPNQLDYNLYVDAARTQIWGDGNGGTSVFSRTVTSFFDRVFVPIYGRIPASQTPAPGSYGDSPLVTIIF
jgi:spore coat protein U-like protein